MLASLVLLRALGRGSSLFHAAQLLVVAGNPWHPLASSLCRVLHMALTVCLSSYKDTSY